MGLEVGGFWRGFGFGFGSGGEVELKGLEKR